MRDSALRELFDAASDAPENERRTLLSQASPDLSAAVSELLAADQLPHEILDQPLVLPLPRQQTLPQQTIVGRYRIVREIGSGGMGSVYLAELADDAPGPKFALKIVRFPSPELARRLVEETRILSRLDHPNIARLLDAGTTADGLPFLAMEYVQGEPIHRFQSPLSLEYTVELMRQVCGAVRYLHQNLVVHRDLKPANILVTENGVVKVVDFGIAKLMNPSPGLESGGITLGPLTPEYASPEQIHGGPLSTLTDVFTVGLVLYELLARVKPFSGSAIEILHKITHEDAPKPSLHNPRIPADLDSIVLHAMHREPERRYASIEQLDEDLRRYQQGLPILARGDSVWYRSRKFVTRNKAAVAGSVAALLLLGAGIATTLVETQRAEQERRKAEVQAKAAFAAQTRAEQSERDALQQRAEALRQQADAERRLNQLGQLATGAVRAYQATLEPSPANSKMLADHVRDVLMVLGREGGNNGEQERLFDGAEAELRSRELAVRSDWEVPDGWAVDGPRLEYRVGKDQTFQYQGKPTLFLRSLTSDVTAPAWVLQTFSASRYRGKRVRFSAVVRLEKVEQSTWLGLGTGGPNFDRSFPMSGTTGWVQAAVVMDVPQDADVISIAAGLFGPGTIWVSNFDFREVDRSTPTGELFSPRNLNFTR